MVCRAGGYVQLYLADGAGKVLSRDPSVILPILETARDIEAPHKLPPGHNKAVSRVREEFARETKLRRAQREQARAATTAQKWVGDRLLELFRQSEDEALKSQIAPVEAALRADGPPRSVERKVAGLYKRKLAGEELWREAVKIYTFHGLKDRPVARVEGGDEWPQIVCSLALE